MNIFFDYIVFVVVGYINDKVFYLYFELQFNMFQLYLPGSGKFNYSRVIKMDYFGLELIEYDGDLV